MELIGKMTERIHLEDDQKMDVQRMASLGYSTVDMSMSIGLSPEDSMKFIQDSMDSSSLVYYLIRQGLLVSRAAPEIKLHEAAETGDVDAIKQLESMRRRHAYEKIISDMDNDEFAG
jgi:hypothetical protein